MRLGDVCRFQNGYAFKSGSFITDGEYKIIKIKELKDGQVRFFQDSASINPSTKLNQYEVAKDDVLFALTGDPVNKNNPLSWVGRVSINNNEKPAYLNQRVCKAIPNEKELDSWYLYYYFRVFENFYALAQRATGSASQANISTSTISDVNINLPPFAEQVEIANTLRTLDEKIAINTKINHHLEQMAQAIFKSWFVDFEPFGGIMPNDWQETLLDEVCVTVTKGTTPTTLKKQFVDQGINFIKAESILGDHSIDFGKLAFIDDETNTLLNRSVIQSNDIIFTIAGTLGRFAFVLEDLLPANTNQAVAIIRADNSKINPVTLYSFFVGGLHSDFYSRNIQQAVQANLSLTTIKALSLHLPPKEIFAKYTNLVEPLFERIFQNYAENRKLATLRDILLPRLMSGELSVVDI